MLKCTCGGKAILLKFDCSILSHDHYYDVHCLKCLKTSIRGFTKISALAAWDRDNKKIKKERSFDLNLIFDKTLIFVGLATMLIPISKIMLDLLDF